MGTAGLQKGDGSQKGDDTIMRERYDMFCKRSAIFLSKRWIGIRRITIAQNFRKKNPLCKTVRAYSTCLRLHSFFREEEAENERSKRERVRMFASHRLVAFPFDNEVYAAECAYCIKLLFHLRSFAT